MSLLRLWPIRGYPLSAGTTVTTQRPAIITTQWAATVLAT